MDDLIFFAPPERVIDHVDDRHERAAAWLATVVILALPPALLICPISWIPS
jgi:hypothetical protein